MQQLSPGRTGWRSVALAALVALPGIFVHYGAFHVPLWAEAALYGVGIMGAAFLLSWTAEVAQLDISQTLAIAVLAIIAVLPEYAVDLFLAFRAGQGDVESEALAVANMTGANRLLIGIGWATVVLVYWVKSRSREIRLRHEQRTDVGYLLLASLWAVFIPLREQIGFLDLAVLGTLFVAYIIKAAKEEVEEPELVGAAATIGALPARRRRLVVLLLFVFSAAAILLVAEPFAHSLREIGETFGISTFLLIQWVAPLASEAPEMIIAILFVLRLRAQAGLGMLISSKVNQWTLLVGSLPLVFSLGAGRIGALPLDTLQQEEVFLTAAQSLFAVAVIANLSVSRIEAVSLLVLFSAQLAIPIPAVRMGMAFGYLALATGMVVFRPWVRRGLFGSLRYALPGGRRELPPAAPHGDVSR